MTEPLHTSTRRRFHRVPIVATLLAFAVLAAGCGDDPLQARSTAEVAPETTAAPVTPPTCPDPTADATRSYDAIDPDAPTTDDKVLEIRRRGRLIVGVAADVLLFSARNPLKANAPIEGFDIEMLKAVARKIFQTDQVDNKIEYRVITYAQRLPSLIDNSVDIVAHTMTINCVRWQQIAFSTTYFDSGQRVLVGRSSTAESVDDLNKQKARICAPEGSTNIDNINVPEYSDLRVVGVSDITDCLVKFQQGDVDAVTGDDTVLAGFAAQDPYAKVVGPAFSSEPYGMGVNKSNVGFVRFVNGVLEQMRSSGEWKRHYDTWLSVLGRAPAPPVAVYGR